MATSYEDFSGMFKVALIQLAPKALDPEFNFNAAAQHIRDAAAQGASLAVLPEYHLTSWVPQDPQFAIIAKTAYSYVSKYQELAKELKINIVAGTIVTTGPTSPSPERSVAATNGSGPAEKPVLLNIAPFISYTGELLGSYTKANLWHPERDFLTSGPQAQSHSDPPSLKSPPHEIIETPLGPVGLLICWDLGFPEAFRALIRAGARIIIAPTFWMATDMSEEGLTLNPDAELLFLKSILVARAIENTCCVIFCNAGGPKEEGYAGLSQVAMPIVGSLPGSFDGPEPGMRVVEVDMKLVDVAERNYKIREDLAKEDFHYPPNFGSDVEPFQLLVVAEGADKTIVPEPTLSSPDTVMEPSKSG